MPRKPYYNPVNLWNARCDVKQKEFIQTIDFPRARALLRISEVARRVGISSSASTRLGSSRSYGPATHPQPLPPVQRTRRAPFAARHLSSSRPRTESRRHRSRSQTPGRRHHSRRKHRFPRFALSPPSPTPRTLARAGCRRHRRLRRLSQRSRTRPDARLHRYPPPHRALLSHQHSFLL